MTPTPVTDGAVTALLDRWFPGVAVAWERMTSGGSTPVYRVKAGSEVTYLRLAEHPGECRDAEVRAHEMALEAGVSVPEVVRFEALPSELDRSAMLTSAMPGIPLHAFTGDPASALREAGRDVARLNAMSVRGWGWVTAIGPDGALEAEFATRVAWCEEYRLATERIAGWGLVDRPRLYAAMNTWLAWPDTRVSCLAHGDFDGTHVYVDPESGAYRGLIDFGEIRGADATYDLGHLVIHDPGYAEGVQEGWGPVDREAVRLMGVAIATRALAIQLERSPNGYRDQLVRRLAGLLAPLGGG